MSMLNNETHVPEMTVCIQEEHLVLHPLTSDLDFYSYFLLQEILLLFVCFILIQFLKTQHISYITVANGIKI